MILRASQLKISFGRCFKSMITICLLVLLCFYRLPGTLRPFVDLLSGSLKTLFFRSSHYWRVSAIVITMILVSGYRLSFSTIRFIWLFKVTYNVFVISSLKSLLLIIIIIITQYIYIYIYMYIYIYIPKKVNYYKYLHVYYWQNTAFKLK